VPHETPQRYTHVAEVLRGRIAEGTYPVGSEIPTVAALATDFGVSHMTVKKALAALSSEGVIATQRGARTRVCAIPSGASKPLLEQVTDLQNRLDGLDSRVTALESHASKRIPRRRP
jgi:DNA-binding GntR family transcriptional regulator